jgi:hypothetical protein
MLLDIGGLVLQDVVQIAISLHKACLMGLKGVDLEGKVVALHGPMVVESVLFTDLDY